MSHAPDGVPGDCSPAHGGGELADKALAERIRQYHLRVEREVASGLRNPRDLLVMADAFPEDIKPKFPDKPYPTSAGAWKAEQAAARSQVMSAAVRKAAAILGLTQQELAVILNIPVEQLEECGRSEWHVIEGSLQWQTGCTLVEIVNCLGLLVGDDPSQATRWLNGFNRAFGAAPREFLTHADGRERILSYLREAASGVPR